MNWKSLGCALAAGTVAGVMLWPSLASADQDDTESGVEIAAKNATVLAGQSLSFTAMCDVGGVAAKSWFSPRGSDEEYGAKSVTTDSDGQAAVAVAIPSDTKPGDYRLSIQCGSSAEVFNNRFTVVGSDKSSTPGTAPHSAVTVAPATVAPGQTITIAGRCNTGDSAATVWYSTAKDSPQAYARNAAAPDTNGHISESIVVSGKASPGSYSAALRCEGAQNPLTASFTVTADSATVTGGTPTGDNSTMLALAGAGMLAAVSLGGAIYMQQRRGIGASALSPKPV